ncbi:envelope biogenesis factor ElyC [Xenorhabdus bovienii]|uniref:YciC family protein n=1 Tax=Xenorhabdus bovienii TaxID=40576 RepID=UPI0023B2E50E|nr:YciC family protein [Xenorhabdus bovienii]MDE9452890.1 envelope biogenesis factor ElyC [Xenorhabdus bovienii]MDE9481146.1 envelope biogenesis factor ElyC [Xenorhabdus bovienii]MDE9555464.1 envelope biogenesis factor ElyC [Xenorhabdus bovienii]
MPITANILYRDSFNFFKNQLLNIFILSVLAALVAALLEHLLMPDGEQLKLLVEIQNAFKESGNTGVKNFVAQLTPEEQLMFLRTAFGILFSNIFGSTLLTANVLLLINAISNGHQTNALHASRSSIGSLPKMFLLMFICTLLIQLGYALMFIPGILLSIAFAFAPVFLLEKGRGVFSSMQESWKLAFANLRLLAPAILLWFAIKLIIALGFARMPDIVLSILNNLLSSILLIYLFRLYMLTKSQNKSANGMQ